MSPHLIEYFIHVSRNEAELQTAVNNAELENTVFHWAEEKWKREIARKNYVFRSNVVYFPESEWGSLFELIGGDLAPLSGTISTGIYEYDENGDVMPSVSETEDSYFEIIIGDISPR